MFNNHLKITLRNLFKERVYTFLNISGLTLGISCFIVLGLYLQNELTYDQHNEKHERIYRVNHDVDYGNTQVREAHTSTFLGPLLIRDYLQIESYVSLLRTSATPSMVRHEQDAYYLDDIYIADNSVFDIFTHEIIHGNPATALTRPDTIAINESTAQLYFGDANPIGETLTTLVRDYEVTLVFADQPDNTHLKYNALIANEGALAPSEDDLINRRGSLWNINAFTYLLLNENVPAEFAESEVFPDFFERMMSDVTRPGYRARFYLEPLAYIHLYSTTSRDLPRGNMYYLYAFSAVGLFVLLIACANYVNLATASASRRSREVSIRKLLGASRRILITQFLFESILFSLIALVLAICLVELLLVGSFEFNLFGKELDLALWQESSTLIELLALATGVGIVAGSYPAFYLATMKSNAQFKNLRRSISNRIRQALILLQFTISMAVISASVLMYLQMQFINNKPLGFELENKVSARIQGADTIERLPVFVDALKTSPLIENVTIVSNNPIGPVVGGAAEARRDDGTVYNLEFRGLRFDAEFLDTMSINLISGRNFDAGSQNQVQSSVIINETAANEIGWNDPVGSIFNIGGGPDITVIGVVEDFHFENMHQEVSPYLLGPDNLDFSQLSDLARANAFREIIIDINPEAVGEALKFVETSWNEFEPAYPLQFQFLEDLFTVLYESDNQQLNLIAVFAIISIIISCLGLFGLTAFTIAARTKEIGMRKTLGALTHQIVLLLFKPVFMLLLIAAVLSAGIAYLGVGGWLEGFHYRDAISPAAFVIAASLTILMAFISLSLQSIRAANQNPVNSLRHE